MTIRLFVVVLLGFFSTACASAPGKWEQYLRGKNAPDPIIANAQKCDAATITGCLQISNYILVTYKDPVKAHEAVQEACDLGNAPACTAASMLKRNGALYQQSAASGGN